MSRFTHLDDLPTKAERYPNGTPYEQQKLAETNAQVLGVCALAGQRLAATLSDYADPQGSPTQMAVFEALSAFHAECDAALAPTRR